MNVRPVQLEGNVIRLEPLSLSYAEDLADIGNDPTIWCYLPYGDITTLEKMRGLVKMFLKNAEKGEDLPFAVIYQETGLPIGCSRYLDIDRGNRKLEIGGTWYGTEFQRSKVNTESKFLLLQHAFENLKCLRVQFKSDARNLRSQKALERIGAVREGVLRNHMILPGGQVRDSVIYSIIEEEWPKIKAGLEIKLLKT